MNKSYISGIIIAIVIGFTLTLGIYALILYLYLLAVASIVSSLIILNSLIRKNAEWKPILKYLSLSYITGLTAILILELRHFNHRKRADEVITALYSYQNKNGTFPLKINELPESIAEISGNYCPDELLLSFKYYYRDLFGFPNVYSSKDSTWNR